MRYIGDFVKNTLKEERVLIEYLVKAFARYDSLPENQQHVLQKAFQVIADNQEFKRSTFDKLLNIFYYTLNMPPLPFEAKPRGSRFVIPADRTKAAKKLNSRINKRKRMIDDAWDREFDESFDWQSTVDQEASKERAKEAMREALGPDRIRDISDGRDPRSAVILPFGK